MVFCFLDFGFVVVVVGDGGGGGIVDDGDGLMRDERENLRWERERSWVRDRVQMREKKKNQ